MNINDIYPSIPSQQAPTPDIVRTGGPNPSAVGTESQVGGEAGKGAAFSWIGFALLLLVLRILQEQRKGRS